MQTKEVQSIKNAQPKEEERKQDQSQAKPTAQAQVLDQKVAEKEVEPISMSTLQSTQQARSAAPQMQFEIKPELENGHKQQAEKEPKKSSDLYSPANSNETDQDAEEKLNETITLLNNLDDEKISRLQLDVSHIPDYNDSNDEEEKPSSAAKQQ